MVQRLCQHLLKENSWPTSSPSFLWPHHQASPQLCPQNCTGQLVQPCGDGDLQRFWWRTSLPSFSYLRKMEAHIHARITTTWTPTPFRMLTLSLSSQNSSMVWRNPPCLSSYRWYSMGVQQYSHSRGRPMEGCIHHPHHGACLNPLSCSSDFATLPPHFKCS